jgi:hypothetical protein
MLGFGGVLRVGLCAMASLAATGCPSNTCLLTVNGRCEWSTCPDGAEFITARKSCACRADRVSLNGACLTLDAANQYCGKGSHFEAGGCAKNRCPPGLEVDQETGYCITPQQANAVASNMGVQVGQNQKLGCPPGEQLVVEGQQAACVPLPQSCGRDEQWDGRECRKLSQCPPGSSYDAPSNSCIKFATEAKDYTVGLRTWIKTSYGVDGGQGTSGFCSGFTKHPLAFGVGAGGSLRVRVGIQVQVPSRQIGDAYVMTAATVDPGGQAVSTKGAYEVQQAAQAVLGALKGGGGKSDEAAASVSVTCVVVNSSKPTAVTVTGGA